MSEIINPGFTCPLSPPAQLFRLLVEDHRVNSHVAVDWVIELSELEIERLLRIPTYRIAWIVTKRLLQ